MNIAEKLAREIRRVALLRGRYEAIGSMPNVNVAPTLLMIDAALEQACKAAGIDDAVVQIAAGQVLEGFTE